VRRETNKPATGLPTLACPSNTTVQQSVQNDLTSTSLHQQDQEKGPATAAQLAGVNGLGILNVEAMCDIA
jgi:hypothetical protein